MAGQGRAGKTRKRPLMRFTGVRNEKPPRGTRGLDGPSGMAYAEFAVKRDESVTGCSSLVNHPTTPAHSGHLVGETTRRCTLNPDRGGGPLDAQRIVGKREPHTGNREMLPTPGETPKGSISNRTSFLGVIPSINRPGSTTEGSIGV